MTVASDRARPASVQNRRDEKTRSSYLSMIKTLRAKSGNLSIRTRLVFLVGFLTAMIVAVGTTGFVGMRSANQAMETVYHDRVVPLTDLAQLVDKLNRLRINAMEITNPSTIHSFEALQAHRTRLDTEIDELWEKFMATRLTPEETELAERFHAALADYRASRDATFDAALSGDLAAAQENEAYRAGHRYGRANATMLKLVEIQEAIAEEEFASATARYAFGRNLALLAIAVALVLSTALGTALIRAVTRPLKRMVSYLREIAKGELGNRIQVDSDNEIGQALKALAATQDAQRSLVEEIKRTAGSIGSASSRIAAGNTDLSQRTEEQAASLQETAASMEEVSATVSNNADHTHQANQIAQQARLIAESGGEKNRQAMERMNELNNTSDRIAGIVTMIDNIAFQTNILALNASVEAARAGDQGRGFAVVAAEVRKLAQRSADAAREIQQLIDLNSDVVTRSSGLVAEAGTAMEDIVGSVRQVSDLMDEIARASAEQTRSIEQVSVAVSQMDQAIQQNATLVEESAVAAAALEDRAHHLTEMVSVFRTGADGCTLPEQPRTRSTQPASDVFHSSPRLALARSA